LLAGEIKKEEARDDPTTASLRNYNRLELSSALLAHTQLKLYNNYITSVISLTNKKCSWPSRVLLVLLQLPQIRHLGTSNYNRL
jgi:hypothetical protein